MRTMLFIFAILFAGACSNTTPTDSAAAGVRTGGPAEAPDFTVEVQGASPGWAYLIGIFAGQQYKVDSAQVDAAGKVEFKRNEPYDQGFMFLSMPDRSTLQMLITEDQTFTMKTAKPDLIGNMVVEGHIDNELLYRNLKFEKDQRPQFDALRGQLATKQEGTPEHAQLLAQQQALLDARTQHLEDIFTEYPNSFFTSFKKAGQNPVVPEYLLPDGTPDNKRRVWEYRTRFWEDVDFTDERLIYTPVVSNKLQRYINELTPQNPDSILSASYFLVDQVPPNSEYYKYFTNWIVTNYDPKESTLMDPQAVFTNMVQKYFTYEKAFWADSVTVFSLQQRAYEMAASLVGKKAPNVTANDPSGQPKTLYDLKSPYLIVYMYNPQCEHCAVETPKLVNFYREWKPKGVDVYGIAIDTDYDEWVAYIRKNNMPWVNVFDPTNKAIYAKYYVDVTPEIYVLNPDRILIAKNLKVEQIAEVIERDMAKSGN